MTALIEFVQLLLIITTENVCGSNGEIKTFGNLQIKYSMTGLVEFVVQRIDMEDLSHLERAGAFACGLLKG